MLQKKQISDALKGENHPNYGKTRSNETKTKISDTKKGISGKNHTEESKKIMSEAKKGKPKVEGSGKPSQQIEVTDIKNNQTTTYDSISEASRALNISSHKIISMYFLRNQNKPYKGQYTFKKL